MPPDMLKITDKVKQNINTWFSEIEKINHNTVSKETRSTVEGVVNLLDSGDIKIADKVDGIWTVNEYAKKAIMLYMKISSTEKISIGFDDYFTRDQLSIYYSDKGAGSRVFGDQMDGEYGMKFFDKVPLKCTHWTRDDFVKANFRIVPGAIVRYGSYIGTSAIIMPSFINIGANIGEGTMIDTWSTVGSCAQVGKRCHISGGVGIGGVLEPANATPVIIEDNVFIGARSEIAEGVIVEEGSVISMGVYLGASTKIIDRETGEIFKGRVPAYSVVVPGSTQTKDGLSLYCAVIVKKVDAQTRAKTKINDLLRD